LGDVFLSCLCGSELINDCTVKLVDFLSCLCGSELPYDSDNIYMNFLSCLCGSELHGYYFSREI